MSKNESERPKYKSKQDIIDNIKENYKHFEKSIVNQLYMKNSLHSTTTGLAREDVWKQLFEMIIPKKFVIEQSVFIIDSSFKNIDSQNGISREVDLAIIDETYTPYIFRYGKIKFVPIEAIAVAVECKSGSADTKCWCNRINKLKTSDNSIARIATSIAMGGVQTQKSTRPIKILCSIEEASNKDLFDICLVAHKDENSNDASIEIIYNNKFNNLFDIYFSLNHDKCGLTDGDGFNKRKGHCCGNPNDKLGEKLNILNEIELESYKVCDSSLLSFNFQLNQILMLINNPLLFPHRDYVDMFNKIEEKDRRKE